MHPTFIMCGFLVFSAYDVTPEVCEELTRNMNKRADPRPRYTLVHYRLQEHSSRTSDLPEQVKTEFGDATYADMYAFMDKVLTERKNSDSMEHGHSMVLDKKAGEDRKVVFIIKSLRSLYIDAENEDEVTDDGTDSNIWRKHRIPFEKVCFFWLVIESKSGLEGDEFLPNTTSETANGLWIRVKSRKGIEQNQKVRYAFYDVC
jgi:hypothetical protein